MCGIGGAHGGRGVVWLAFVVSLVFAAPAMAQKSQAHHGSRPEIVSAFVRDWPPQYALDAEGQPTGFAHDVLKEVAKLAGFRIRFRVAGSFAETFRDIEDGRVDVIPNLGITPEGALLGAFTAPVETFAISVFARRDARQIARISDLAGRRIGVVRNNAGAPLVSAIDGAVPVVRDNARGALVALVAGQLDAVIFPRPVFLSLARQLGLEDRIRTLGPPLRDVKRGILVAKGNPALWRRLDKAVRDFVGTPEYERIYSKWYGDSSHFWTVARVSWTIGGLALFGLLCSFGWRYHSVSKLNKKLGAQANILRAVLDNVDQGISLFDANLNSLAFNDRFIELLDLPPQENRVGVPYERFVRTVAERGEYGPGDVESQVRERLDAARRFAPRNYVRQGANGVTIDVRGNPIPGGGFVTTYTDVTEQGRAEEALRISERQLSEAQRIGRIGHWRYLSDSHRFEASEAFYRIYGWDPDRFDITYAAITEAMHPDDRTRVTALRRDAGRHKVAYTCEFRIVRPDGEIRHIRGEGRPEFDDNGALVSFFGVNQDVTEQKKAEEELLRERTRAELANRAKSEFLANMSHEIRTPLNAIIGFADIIEQQVFGSIDNERYAAYVADIHASAKHLLDLVNDILDISTIEAGELALSPEYLDVGAIFDECARVVREQARKAELTLEIELRDTGLTVYADRRALRQILLNLMSNAIKFTPPKGRITVAATESEDSFLLSVTDTGIGIPAQNLSKIVQPFETGSNDPHTSANGNPYIRTEGTGLGLAIVRSLAHLHGGDLAIESEEGCGTTVRVWIPRRRRAAA